MDNTTDVIGEFQVLGGPIYMKQNQLTSGIYLLIAGFACVVGTLGNLCILGSVALFKPLRHTRNTFVVNLAIADLTITSFADPMGILGLVYGSKWFTDRLVFCDLIATVCLTACVTALFSIGGDGFSRYFHICRPEYYHKVFTLRTNILLSCLFWVVGILMALPPLLGWTKNVYDPKYLECIWDRKFNMSYTIFFSSCVVALPVTIIAFSFLNIYLHVRASKKRLSKGDGKKMTSSTDSSIRLAKSLFVVFVGFVTCWTPYAVIVLVDFGDKLPEELHLFILLLAHMHSTINCIIYALTNSQFRKGYLVLLCKVFPCIKRAFIDQKAKGDNSVAPTTVVGAMSK